MAHDFNLHFHSDPPPDYLTYCHNLSQGLIISTTITQANKDSVSVHNLLPTLIHYPYTDTVKNIRA